ncbi:DUF2177 family protein [Tardiphaga sp. vice352]|uniref:DUF2177 family protein n=1 Tax=Tardiphaga sp. vice352 TaxID=2592816 RepID=UPI001165BE8C|nr:DUF2177 family protein [Tardiphaga sp. vice352]
MRTSHGKIFDGLSGNSESFYDRHLVWLSRTIGLYRSAIGEIMLETPGWKAAISFYLMYIVGIVYFVIAPAHPAGSWTSVMLSGALFGLLAFATSDMTNLATLRG